MLRRMKSSAALVLDLDSEDSDPALADTLVRNSNVDAAFAEEAADTADESQDSDCPGAEAEVEQEQEQELEEVQELERSEERGENNREQDHEPETDLREEQDRFATDSVGENEQVREYEQEERQAPIKLEQQDIELGVLAAMKQEVKQEELAERPGVTPRPMVEDSSASQWEEQIGKKAAFMEGKFSKLLELAETSTAAPSSPGASSMTSTSMQSTAPATPQGPPEVSCEAIAKLSSAALEALPTNADRGEPLQLHGGPLAKVWTRALQDPAFKIAYKAEKGYAAQREFRNKWAKQMWRSAVHHRKKIDHTSELARSKADFDPISVWIGRGGGGYEAVQGIEFFFKKVELQQLNVLHESIINTILHFKNIWQHKQYSSWSSS